MTEFNFRSKKQYWSAMKNMHSKINDNTDSGRAIRKRFYNITSDKKFKESNFKKSDKKITKTDFRKAFSVAKKKNEKALRDDYNEMKKDPKLNVGTWKAFKEANQTDDYEAIKEYYNSPT